MTETVKKKRDEIILKFPGISNKLALRSAHQAIIDESCEFCGLRLKDGNHGKCNVRTRNV